MSKKLLSSIVALIITLVLAVGVTFAWFQGAYSIVENWQFTTAKLDIKSELYQLSDFNKDGVVDINEDGTFIYTIQGYKDIEQTQPIYAISASNSTLNTLPLEISQVVPGDIVTFKLVVHNIGTDEGVLYLRLKINDSALNPNVMRKVLTFNVLDNTLNKTNVSHLEIEKVDANSDNVVMGEKAGATPLHIPAGENLEVHFSVEFETLANLRAYELANNSGLNAGDSGYSTYFANMNNLNEFYNKSIGILLQVELVQLVNTK